MKHARLLAGVVIGLGFGVGPVLAQDAVKVAPNVYKVILENERVRVLSVTLQPGEKAPMHSHPPNIVYPLNAATVRFLLPDGTKVDADIKADEVSWHEGEIHATENVGTTELRALVVELKGPPASRKK